MKIIINHFAKDDPCPCQQCKALWDMQFNGYESEATSWSKVNRYEGEATSWSKVNGYESEATSSKMAASTSALWVIFKEKTLNFILLKD